MAPSSAALRFEISARGGPACPHARVGRVTTPHGSFDTPAFMPVGTRGTVKGVLPEQVRASGAQILLNNTYHLLLRPGPEIIERLGGVHRFMNWDGPILTDSGGYQAYSMADINAVDDDGVTFKSVIDGSMIRLTPERAIAVQNQLGPDIIMAFDDCPPSVAGEGDPRLTRVLARDRVTDHAARLDVANERTVRWLERCKTAHRRAHDQALFGIVQGGTDLARRSWCVERVCGIDLPGYAIGGVAVGETHEDIARVVRHTAPLMPEGKPRYLMGVGYERDIVAAVLAGVDMFDCVLPTRNARNAFAFTRGGAIKLRNAVHAEDAGPVEAGCDCPCCAPGMGGQVFSRAYLRHLFMAGEMLGPVLLTLHNLRHYQRLMRDLRGAIVSGDWLGFAGMWPMTAGAVKAGLAAGAHLA